MTSPTIDKINAGAAVVAPANFNIAGRLEFRTVI